MDSSVPAGPAFGQARPALPAAGAFLLDIAGEDRVGLPPRIVGKPPGPDRLLFRPVDNDGPEALELSPAAAIEEDVIVEPFR
jgi:hypothetical protein